MNGHNVKWGVGAGAVSVIILGAGLAVAGHAFANRILGGVWGAFQTQQAQLQSSGSKVVVGHIDGTTISKQQFDLFKNGQNLFSGLKKHVHSTNGYVWGFLVRQIVLETVTKQQGYGATDAEAQKVVAKLHQEYLQHLNSPIGSLTVQQFQHNLETALGISDSYYWGPYLVNAEKTQLAEVQFQDHWGNLYMKDHPGATRAGIETAWNSYLSSLVAHASVTAPPSPGV